MARRSRNPPFWVLSSIPSFPTQLHPTHLKKRCAKLRRCVSWVHFAKVHLQKIHFRKIHPEQFSYKIPLCLSGEYLEIVWYHWYWGDISETPFLSTREKLGQCTMYVLQPYSKGRVVKGLCLILTTWYFGSLLTWDWILCWRHLANPVGSLLSRLLRPLCHCFIFKHFDWYWQRYNFRFSLFLVYHVFIFYFAVNTGYHLHRMAALNV